MIYNYETPFPPQVYDGPPPVGACQMEDGGLGLAFANAGMAGISSTQRGWAHSDAQPPSAHRNHEVQHDTGGEWSDDSVLFTQWLSGSATSMYSDSGQASPTRITLLGTVPNRPRCAWCTHPLDVHGPTAATPTIAGADGRERSDDNVLQSQLGSGIGIGG